MINFDVTKLTEKEVEDAKLFLNVNFAHNLPAFIKSVVVTDLSFGDRNPVVILRELVEPPPRLLKDLLLHEEKKEKEKEKEKTTPGVVVVGQEGGGGGGGGGGPKEKTSSSLSSSSSSRDDFSTDSSSLDHEVDRMLRCDSNATLAVLDVDFNMGSGYIEFHVCFRAAMIVELPLVIRVASLHIRGTGCVLYAAHEVRTFFRANPLQKLDIKTIAGAGGELRGLESVEKYVVSKLQSILDEHLVYPSCAKVKIP